jgi:hypothetical protein
MQLLVLYSTSKYTFISKIFSENLVFYEGRWNTHCATGQSIDGTNDVGAFQARIFRQEYKHGIFSNYSFSPVKLVTER